MNEVVLIIPRYEMKNIMTAKKEDVDKSATNLQLYPSLGISYLASCLEKNNINTMVIDVGASSITQDDVIKILKQEQPLLVGIYVNSFSLYSTYLLIKKIKKAIKTKVIVGGNHITHDPSAIVHLGADYGFRGEAEENFPLIVKAIKENKEPEDLCGLVKIKDEKIVCNGIASIGNLDSIPFPTRHFLSGKNYYTPFFNGKITTMFTSRGCTFNCIFCSSYDKKIRIRSPENVVEEIEYLINEGFDFISFEDDFFTFDQDRVRKICDLIIKKNIKIKWMCTTRADFVNLDLLNLMKKAGCFLISFGIESGDEKTRNKVIGKYVSDEKIIAAFKDAKKIKIKTLAYCMFGHPGEKLENMEKTLKFVLEINPDYVDFSLSTIIPGSKLSNIAFKEKKISKNIWLNIIKNNELIPIYVPDGLTLENLKKIQKNAFLRFYFRYNKILQEFKNIRNIDDFLFRVKIVFKLIKYF